MKIRLSDYEEGVADGREESEEIIRQQQAEIEALKEQCVLLQEGYNAQAILLGVETGLIPDFFFMENDLMGKR